MTLQASESKRELLRHTVATLAYRGGKAIRQAPSTFGAFNAAGDRTPLVILSHIGDLLEWALSIVEGKQRWPTTEVGAWDAEAERFFGGLARLDAYLASDAQLAVPPEKVFQGPIADALTHVGQLNMLRRMAGAPIRGENYYVAEIVAGRVGTEQAAPRREFD
jgi:hypothetical protein